MKRFVYEYSHNKGNTPVMLHRYKAEKALGRPLPAGAVVHHADGNSRNNENRNLVICPSEKYHNLLHIRLEAMQTSGNPNHRKCYVCKSFDDTKNMHEITFRGKIVSFYHSDCRRLYRQAYKNKTGRSI